MVGNDVVDLRDPEARPGAQHPRFDARVFAACEREAIARSADPARTRWTLWAVKEAAFKCARRREPGRSFSPRAWRVDLAAGRVEGADLSLCARLLSTPGAAGSGADDVVHVVVADPDARIAAAAAPLAPGADASRAARALAVATLSRLLGHPASDLAVRSGPGRAPRLVGGRRRGIDLALSLSHHGRWVAFAAELAA